MKTVRLDGEDIYPSKIVCVGRNYIDHIRELSNEIPKEPVIFIKPNSSISSEIHSHEHDVIHFEGEITFVIRFGKLSAVGFGLDLTKREIQNRLKSKGLPWERAKSFNRSAVFSDFVSFTGKLENLRMELYINGTLTQQGGCDLMLNQPEVLLNEAMSFLSLEDGDLLMTGTPSGVGPIYSGDRFIGKIFEHETLIVEASWLVK